mmetsp:Transcript_65769/g.183459  ORF Transcript_65769/g.183459 Transcript_65769/m.183459 type:complete len:203 (+) Transcript_65769:252-860(+)
MIRIAGSLPQAGSAGKCATVTAESNVSPLLEVKASHPRSRIRNPAGPSTACPTSAMRWWPTIAFRSHCWLEGPLARENSDFPWSSAEPQMRLASRVVCCMMQSLQSRMQHNSATAPAISLITLHVSSWPNAGWRPPPPAPPRTGQRRSPSRVAGRRSRAGRGHGGGGRVSSACLAAASSSAICDLKLMVSASRFRFCSSTSN